MFKLFSQLARKKTALAAFSTTQDQLLQMSKNPRFAKNISISKQEISKPIQPELGSPTKTETSAITIDVIEKLLEREKKNREFSVY